MEQGTDRSRHLWNRAPDRAVHECGRSARRQANGGLNTTSSTIFCNTLLTTDRLVVVLQLHSNDSDAEAMQDDTIVCQENECSAKRMYDSELVCRHQ